MLHGFCLKLLRKSETPAPLPQRWTASRKCKLNKPFLPQVAFPYSVFSHNRRKLGHRASWVQRGALTESPPPALLDWHIEAHNFLSLIIQWHFPFPSGFTFEQGIVVQHSRGLWKFLLWWLVADINPRSRRPGIPRLNCPTENPSLERERSLATETTYWQEPFQTERTWIGNNEL